MPLERSTCSSMDVQRLEWTYNVTGWIEPHLPLYLHPRPTHPNGYRRVRQRAQNLPPERQARTTKYVAQPRVLPVRFMPSRSAALRSDRLNETSKLTELELEPIADQLVGGALYRSNRATLTQSGPNESRRVRDVVGSPHCSSPTRASVA